MLLDNDELRQNLIDAIKQKRRDTKTDDFQFPLVELTSYSMHDGLDFYSIEINKIDCGRKKYKNIDDVVDNLYSSIYNNQNEIKKLMKKYKIE